MWLLEAGEFVVINLEKREERFWTAVLEGDTEIDKSKVDTTRDISDFDEQTQSDFEHVMYDHHQKLQGKPTSQEKVCFSLYINCKFLSPYIPKSYSTLQKVNIFTVMNSLEINWLSFLALFLLLKDLHLKQCLGSQAGVADINHAFHLYYNVVCGLSLSQSQPDFEGFLRALRLPPSAKLTSSSGPAVIGASCCGDPACWRS